MKAQHEDIRERISQTVIDAMLNDHVVPWRRTWSTVPTRMPTNLLTTKTYRGINVLALWLKAAERNFTSSEWLTFKQANELGAAVKKGERGTCICFWRSLVGANTDVVKDTTADSDSKSSRRFVARGYVVFNREQIEGLSEPATEEPLMHTPIERAERIIAAMPKPPSIEIRLSNMAFYSPALDRIVLPMPSQFETPEDYYSTTFHELAHSTGHQSRLNRETIAELKNDEHAYSKEELVAEMTAAFLCAEAGILPSTVDNSLAYLVGWVKRIRVDKRLISDAAAAAQRACDYILDRTSSSSLIEAEPTQLSAAA